MLYEYHTDLSRKLNELGRMFVAIHRKQKMKLCNSSSRLRQRFKTKIGLKKNSHLVKGLKDFVSC